MYVAIAMKGASKSSAQRTPSRGTRKGTRIPGATARLAAEHGLREAHHGTFAILFWFLVLTGPLGAVIYPLTQRAARMWDLGVDPNEREFGWLAGRAFAVLDWIPQRVSAFVIAIVGNFEDALFCWRSQAAQWLRPEEGIVLASGAGALGVRLGEPIARGESLVDRPTLGTGEVAGEEALSSLAGMLWRSLVLWLVAFLLWRALTWSLPAPQAVPTQRVARVGRRLLAKAHNRLK